MSREYKRKLDRFGDVDVSVNGDSQTVEVEVEGEPTWRQPVKSPREADDFADFVHTIWRNGEKRGAE